MESHVRPGGVTYNPVLAPCGQRGGPGIMANQSQLSHAHGGDGARTSAGDISARDVELTDATGRVGAEDLRWIGTHAHAALAALGLAGVVRVKVIDDAEMTSAHAEFLDDPTTTDVLTFDMSEDGVLDVDILVCLDVAERQGRDRGHAARRELLLYIVHGVLHCAGYDDHDEESCRRMHAREDEVLALIGAGATYQGERDEP